MSLLIPTALPPRDIGYGTLRGARRGMARSDTIKLVLGVVALVAALGIIVWQWFGRGPDIGESLAYCVSIDAGSGEVFEKFRVPEGQQAPWANPKTGTKALYPAELCWWNKDGSVRAKPTYVLLNQYKGSNEETRCPDCGRRVVARNPAPSIEKIEAAVKAAGK